MVLRLALLLLVAATLQSATAAADDNVGVRIALRVYDECSARDEGFGTCLKKKAITFLTRLERMDKISLSEGVNVIRTEERPKLEALISEEQIDKSLPRGADAQNDALNQMLMDKLTGFVSSRTLQVSLPKIDLGLEEGRGKKMKGMMHGMMMGMAAKMAAMVPVAIAGLFLLAGKALITAKIALLLSGIIALKKLVSAKQSGGGGGGHGGGGGGWSSGGGSGGGWDKRSFDDAEAQKLAYRGHSTV